MELKTISSSSKIKVCSEMKYQEFKDLFIDPKTEEVKEKILYERVCPVCGLNEQDLLFKKFGLNYVQCGCGMTYISPYIDFQERSKWYETSKGYSWFWREIVHKARQERIKFIWNVRMETLKSKGISFNSVLDIGCGSGEFVEMVLKENKGKVLGIEPNRSAVEIAQSYVGDAVIQDIFQNMNFTKEAYSLVSMWEVFHHFDNPLEVSQKLFGLLRPGGHLVMQSPNFEGFDYKTLGEYHHDVTYEIPNYFSIKSISELLVRSGFSRDKIYVSTPGRLDVEYVLLGVKNHGRKIIQDKFTMAVLDAIESGDEELIQDLQHFLIAHKMSGSMFIVAEKGDV